MNPIISNDPYRRALNEADRSSANAELAAFFSATYRWMALGLALTGLIAYLVAGSPAAVETIIYNRPVFYVCLGLELAVVFAFSLWAQRVSPVVALAMFLGYAALNGLTFSVFFLRYSQSSVAQVFFVTAGAFTGLSVFGMATKRDLSPVGRFMMMGLFGLIIAGVVSIFIPFGGAGQFIMSCVGVLVFAGLTAYDTQKLKELYTARGSAGNLAMRGALLLYLDFINLFIFLLRLFGNRRD